MKSFIALFVIFTIATIEGETLRISRQAYIWNARACDNGGSPPNCCLNRASNPDCCLTGSGKYCCWNGANNPECILGEEDKSHDIAHQIKTKYQ